MTIDVHDSHASKSPSAAITSSNCWRKAERAAARTWSSQGTRLSSKRFQTASGQVDPAKAYALPEAVALLKGLPPAKFDETIDVAINLGVDPKHADQMVRGAVVLPHGLGKSARVLVFAKGEKEHEARDAGWAKIMADPRMQPDANPMPFDGQRLIWGGFQPIVEG